MRLWGAWLLGSVRLELGGSTLLSRVRRGRQWPYVSAPTVPAESGDALALKALDRMARAIGLGMRMIVAGLSPEEIVFVGEFTRLWDRIGPVIEASVAAAVPVGKPPRVRPAKADPSTARLRGTVATVLQKHFGPVMERSRHIKIMAATSPVRKAWREGVV
jgi:predicted NBD/HSP70 family sugar kinase